MRASDIPQDVRERWLGGAPGNGCHCHNCTEVCHPDIPGHFIGATDCHFFGHSGNERYCVSTVGDYRPGGMRRELGYQRSYETMVFDKTAEHRLSEVDVEGYNSEPEAIEGHRRMVAKWLEAPTDAAPTKEQGTT